MIIFLIINTSNEVSGDTLISYESCNISSNDDHNSNTHNSSQTNNNNFFFFFFFFYTINLYNLYQDNQSRTSTS